MASYTIMKLAVMLCCWMTYASCKGTKGNIAWTLIYEVKELI